MAILSESRRRSAWQKEARYADFQMVCRTTRHNGPDTGIRARLSLHQNDRGIRVQYARGNVLALWPAAIDIPRALQPRSDRQRQRLHQCRRQDPFLETATAVRL